MSDVRQDVETIQACICGGCAAAADRLAARIEELERTAADGDEWKAAYELAAESRDEAREALRRAEAGFREAEAYGCEWPIGTDDEPQESRGGPRDTFITNMGVYAGDCRRAALGEDA